MSVRLASSYLAARRPTNFGHQKNPIVRLALRPEVPGVPRMEISHFVPYLSVPEVSCRETESTLLIDGPTISWRPVSGSIWASSCEL